MNGEGVREIIDVATRSVKQVVETVKLEVKGHESGKQFVVVSGKLQDPETLVHRDEAEALQLETLTGLVDYLKANVDKANLDEHMIVVDNPTRVLFLSKLHADRRDRETLVTAESPSLEFRFGQYMDQAAFTIALLTQFQNFGGDDLELLVKTCSKIVAEEAVTAQDDGVSQTVITQATAGSRAEVQLKPLQNLRPYRTFRELTLQPASLFLLRIQRAEKQPPKLALIEADGGAWRNEARLEIKRWLDAKIKDAGLTVKVLA